MTRHRRLQKTMRSPVRAARRAKNRQHRFDRSLKRIALGERYRYDPRLMVPAWVNAIDPETLRGLLETLRGLLARIPVCDRSSISRVPTARWAAAGGCT
jgi:hypothetical protein